MDVLIQLVRIALGVSICLATYQGLTLVRDMLVSKR